jgi:peptidoglycan/LPS O-acetylase OafA/YrhL
MGNERLHAPEVLISGFFLVGLDNQALLTVAWSLFHEVLFYGLFGLLIVSRRLGIVVLAVWFAACAIFGVIGAAPHYALQPINLLFGMGMLAAWWLAAGEVKYPMVCMGMGVAAFVLLGVEANYVHRLTMTVALMGVGLASTLFVLGAVEAERQDRIRAPRILRLLGDASYSIYLAQPTLSAFAKVFAVVPFLRALPIGLTAILVTGLCVLCGIAFWALVERPMVRWLNQRILDPGPRAAVAITN